MKARKKSGSATRIRTVLAGCLVLEVVLAIGWRGQGHWIADGPASRAEVGDAPNHARALPVARPDGNDAAGRPPVGMALSRRKLARAAFLQARLCYDARMDVLGDRSRIAACESITPQDLAENRNACRTDLDRLPRHLAQAEARLAECRKHYPDVDDAYFWSTRSAAATGDPDAQMCYLVGGFGDRNFDARELNEFKSTVPQYISAAMRRGDWRVVELLGRTGYSHSFDPIAHAVQRTPVVEYRMNRLLRWGATGGYAEQLDRIAEVSRSPRYGQLSHAQAEQAEAWARQTYRRYFISSPPLHEAPVACSAQ